MRISDWSSDVCSSDLGEDQIVRVFSRHLFRDSKRIEALVRHIDLLTAEQFGSPARQQEEVFGALGLVKEPQPFLMAGTGHLMLESSQGCPVAKSSEAHTSELPSLMRSSYAVFCLQK